MGVIVTIVGNMVMNTNKRLNGSCTRIKIILIKIILNNMN